MKLLSGTVFLCSALLSAVSGEEQCVAPPGPALQKPLTLKYWSGRGLMEIGRMILAIAGKFPVNTYVQFLEVDPFCIRSAFEICFYLFII
jgi:hypothetical protein